MFEQHPSRPRPPPMSDQTGNSYYVRITFAAVSQMGIRAARRGANVVRENNILVRGNNFHPQV